MFAIKKDALLTEDFFDFYEKIKYIDFYENQNIIDKAINERYGYYYNKYDSNRFEKFKQYLNNNIPSELITYLTSDNFIEHNTIKKVKVLNNIIVCLFIIIMIIYNPWKEGLND